MHNHELVFANEYSEKTLVDSNIPDRDNPLFRECVESTVKGMVEVMAVQPGVRQVTTFVDFSGMRYKLRVVQEH